MSQSYHLELNFVHFVKIGYSKLDWTTGMLKKIGKKLTEADGRKRRLEYLIQQYNQGGQTDQQIEADIIAQFKRDNNRKPKASDSKLRELVAIRKNQLGLNVISGRRSREYSNLE
jgi:hypothetical protein